MSDNQRKNGLLNVWLAVIGIILFIVLIVVILLFLMKGETTITRSDERVEVRSVTCEADDVAYPYFPYDESESKNLKINAIFKDNELDSISLVYILNYANEDDAKKSELKNHIDFEVGIQDEGLKHEYLNTDHTIMDSVYQMSMYNSRSELTKKIAKYYLINSIKEDYTQANVEKMLTKKGLNCTNN